MSRPFVVGGLMMWLIIATTCRSEEVPPAPSSIASEAPGASAAETRPAVSAAAPATASSLAPDLKALLSQLKVGEEREIDGAKFRLVQLQAESPLGAGWHRALAKEGGFSVELPLPFNEFRMRSVVEPGVELSVSGLGAKSAGMLSWAASCLRRSDGRLSGGKEGVLALGTPVKAWQRTLVVGDRICVLIVEAQGNDPLPNSADRNRFLNSFRKGQN